MVAKESVASAWHYAESKAKVKRKKAKIDSFLSTFLLFPFFFCL